jgi:Ca2+-binding RTX toxin-like protein
MGTWTPGPGPTGGDDTFLGDSGNEVASGAAGNDTLKGNGGNDALSGDAGNDNLDGGDGNDFLTDGNPTDNDNDVLLGGPGDDRINSYSGGDTINGGSGIDTLFFNRALSTSGYTIDFAAAILGTISLADGTQITGVEILLASGGSGNDQFFGADQNDRLDGGAGDDILLGRGGFDILDGGYGNDQLDGGDDADILNGREGEDVLSGGNGSDSLDGGAGADQLDGGDGNDRLVELSLEQVIDTLRGGAGNDHISSSARGDVIDGGEGTDWLELDLTDLVIGTTVVLASGGSTTIADGSQISNIEQISIYGGSGDDVFTFIGAGFATFYGGGGNDYLTGGAGGDSLIGQQGDDIVVGGAGNDQLQGWAGNDRLDGGDGDDRIDDDFSNGDNGLDVLIGGAGDDRLYSHSGVDSIDGGDGNDYAQIERGNTGVNYVVDMSAVGAGPVDIGDGTIIAGIESISLHIYGQPGAITLTGGDFADDISGGLGADWADGRGGSDLFFGYGGDDTLIGGDGDDTLYGQAGDDTLIGGNDKDRIEGDEGNDLLVGGTGADTLDGGTGLDTASYASSGSGVVVHLTGSIYGGDAEGDTLASIENVTGSGFGDNLRGDAQANVLDGLGGNDVLDGGLGADTLRAGAGDDYVYFDELDLSSGQVRGGTGYDWIYNVTSGPLAALLVVNLATLEGEGYYGSNGAEQVNASGVATSVTLYGNGGADRLTGGSGDDYIYFDAADLAGGSIAGGAGYDWAFLNEQVGVSLNLATTGFEGAYGRNGNDTFNASAKTSSVTLYGNGGADTLIGGSGNDYIYFDALDLSGGSITGGAGYDWAILNEQVGVSLNLAARGFEGAYGRDGNDTFNASGVATSVTLYGNGGADTLIGGSGGDYIYFDSADLASGSISGGAGYDYAIFNELGVGATLNLTATGFEGAVGRNGNDVFTAAGTVSSVSLYGYEGNDQLTGGSGSDYLYGDIGNDTLTGGAGTDYFITYTGWGADTLTDFQQGTDRVVMSVAGLTAFSQLTITQSGADALVTFGANSLRFSNTSAASIDVSDFLNLANALPAMLSADRVEEARPATPPDIGGQSDGGETFTAADLASLVYEMHQGFDYAPSSVSTDIYQPWVASIGQDDDIFSLLDGLTVEAEFGVEAALPAGGSDALGDLDHSQPSAPVVDHSGAWMIGV